MTTVESDTWPTIRYDYTVGRQAHSFAAELDGLREQSPFYWSSYGPQGFWMFLRHEHVREALTDYRRFTSQSVDVLNPDRVLAEIPITTDPPVQRKYRQILNPFFGPTAMERIEGDARRICARLIDQMRDAGAGEMDDFCLQFPTEAFVHMVGLPLSDADFLVPIVKEVFRGIYGSDKSRLQELAMMVMDYFKDVITDRRLHPRDPDTDFVTYLLASDVDGRLLTDEEVQSICWIIILAGLDTTRSQLGYMFEHFASHPGDQRRVVGDPTLVGAAVEETVRIYNIVGGQGRKAAEDFDFHGLPIKQNDMIWLSVAAANRDPRAFANPTYFDLDREENHLGFGLGPHRCLGSHLARLEMNIALEEWHRAIPQYQLADDCPPVAERGGLHHLSTIPLVWPAVDDRP